MLHATWNTGWLIGMYVIIAIQLVALLGSIGLGIFLRSWAIPAVGFIIVLIMGAIGTVVAFPFSGVYHRYQPISGYVQNVNSRFLSDGTGGTNQNFVVTIRGTAYRVDDTRASLLKKGSPVTLMCQLNYQFNAAPGWVCNWGKFGLNGH